MSKGSGRRPESEPNAYANGWDAAFRSEAVSGALLSGGAPVGIQSDHDGRGLGESIGLTEYRGQEHAVADISA